VTTAVRLAAAAGTLAVLVWHLGTSPFLDGLRAVDGAALRDTSDVGRGLRAVAWERSAGQVVQVVLIVAVLLVLYGVMVFVASLPGAAVLVANWAWRTRPAPWIERHV
jgi:hypothetical protein